MKTKDDIVNDKIKRANETIEQAELMLQNDYYGATLNRLYYAMFYAVSALLLKKGIFSKTHAGTKSQFHNTFVRTGQLSKDEGDLYDQLFERRMEGDYSDFFTISKDDTLKLFTLTQQSLTNILNFIPTIDQ